MYQIVYIAGAANTFSIFSMNCFGPLALSCYQLGRVQQMQF